MSDISQLTILREQAAKFQELQQAGVKLAELERQAQQEQALEQALARAAHDQAEFDQALASFQGEKAESDSALKAWLARGQEIIERRQALGIKAKAIQEMAWKLAESQLRAGLVKSPLGASDAIRGQAEQILIDRTGHKQLMTFPNQDGPAGVLLAGITSFTGDWPISQRKPARIVIETANGPVTELR